MKFFEQISTFLLQLTSFFLPSRDVSFGWCFWPRSSTIRGAGQALDTVRRGVEEDFARALARVRVKYQVTLVPSGTRVTLENCQRSSSSKSKPHAGEPRASTSARAPNLLRAVKTRVGLCGSQKVQRALA